MTNKLESLEADTIYLFNLNLLLLLYFYFSVVLPHELILIKF